MTAIASRITATAMDPTAALFIVSLISSVMYHADRSKEKRYSQARTMLNGKVSEPSFKGSACLRQATSHDIRASEASRRPFFSLDHLVRSEQHIRRNCETDLLRCFQIDNELKLLRLFHGQISGLGTFQDFVDVVRSTPIEIIEVHAIRQETAFIDKLLLRVNRRQPVFAGKLDNPFSCGEKGWVAMRH